MDERTDHLGELPVFWRRAEGPCATALHLHDSPMSSDEMLPFLEAHGGVAPDLPGFGRSGKPGHFPYSLDGYAGFLDGFLDLAGLDEVDLVMHGWGAVGLAWAARSPGRVRRLVLIAPAPLLTTTEWPWFDRALSRRLVGELVVGALIKPVFTRMLRRGGGEISDALVEHAWKSFDPGTQRAILLLRRNTDLAARAALERSLTDIRVPALVACGSFDPYSGPAWADAFRGRLADATVEVVSETGHWPWLDQKDVIERVSSFLTGGMPAPGS